MKISSVWRRLLSPRRSTAAVSRRRSASPQRMQQPARRPILERLEDRLAPATLTYTQATGLLQFAGLTTADDVTVRAAGASLFISGGSFSTVTYNYINAHDGSVNLDGSIINYTSLEPITNTGNTATAIF